MACCIVVNACEEVGETQTTWLLGAALAAEGAEVVFCGVRDLELGQDGRVWARVRPCDALRVGPGARRCLETMDRVLIRTSPARDQAHAAYHEAALQLLSGVAGRGVPVINAPTGLMQAASKLYLQWVAPAHRPETLVSADADHIRAFAARCPEGIVIKPANGTRGSNVFRLRHPELDNLNQIVEVVAAEGPVVVQRFLPEAREGDVRLIVMGGQPLSVAGSVAAVQRVPGSTDFRSNVHVGAVPVAATPTAGQLAVATALGPRLRRDGLFLVGLDLIGDRLVEINVFSTGGLLDASRFTGVDFTQHVAQAVLRGDADRFCAANVRHM